MTVWVDDMYRYSIGRFRNMNMSHMIADTEDELHAMAARIGVARKWYQGDHYDIAMSKRNQALHFGALQVDYRTLGIMVSNRKAGWPLGPPELARSIFKIRHALAKVKC